MFLFFSISSTTLVNPSPQHVNVPKSLQIKKLSLNHKCSYISVLPPYLYNKIIIITCNLNLTFHLLLNYWVTIAKAKVHLSLYPYFCPLLHLTMLTTATFSEFYDFLKNTALLLPDFYLRLQPVY